MLNMDRCSGSYERDGCIVQGSILMPAPDQAVCRLLALPEAGTVRIAILTALIRGFLLPFHPHADIF